MLHARITPKYVVVNKRNRIKVKLVQAIRISLLIIIRYSTLLINCAAMSHQQQQRRPQGDDQKRVHGQDQPIKYGDVFDVSGDLAEQAIAPRDAAMMQSAENLVLGQTQKGGPAAVMQSAAALNERAGLVKPDDYSESPADKGVSVTETDLPGRRIVTESVAGQVGILVYIYVYIVK